MLKESLHTVSANPRKLLLIDGFGALLSAFLLGIVLVQLESLFGIPPKTLYFLAFLPCLFAIYDFYCYYRTDKNLSVFLQIIALVNITYCVISLGFAGYHQESLTLFGWLYILGEIGIVLLLAYVELKTAQKIKE